MFLQHLEEKKKELVVVSQQLEIIKSVLFEIAQQLNTQVPK